MKIHNQILLHFFFWLFFLGLPVISTLLGSRGEPGLYLYLGVISLINILNFYLCYFLTGRFMLQGSRSLHNFWMLIPVVVFFVFLRMAAERGVAALFPWEPMDALTFTMALIKHVINTIIFSGISILIAFLVGWVKAQRQKDELEKQNQQAELALLRSQINPHFLFNTLNNLYALVYRKSDEAPGALMKLSEIMRYMLYDSNEEKVPLEKEVAYIRSYIELQQLRMKTPNFIRFDMHGDPGGKMIPPMLLVTFVENAFKHGNKVVNAPGIVITVNCTDEEFTFEISSYLVNGQLQNKDPNSGIGLQNVKRRLELMYPDKHDLLVGLSDDKFYVKLRIDNL